MCIVYVYVGRVRREEQQQVEGARGRRLQLLRAQGQRLGRVSGHGAAHEELHHAVNFLWRQAELEAREANGEARGEASGRMGR